MAAQPEKKIYVTAEDQLLDSFRLATQIHASGFRPNFLLGLWRGGSAVGIAVQECLEYLGVSTDHIAVRTSYTGQQSYQRLISGEQPIGVHGLQYLLETLDSDDSLLIVDDVYSTGLNIQAVIDQLAQKTRRNMPHEVKIAVPWYKPKNNRTGRVPDFYLHETDDWLVLPYELQGLTLAEIREHKLGLKPIFDELESLLATLPDIAGQD